MGGSDSTSGKAPRVAIVTTLRNAEPVLNSFITYHLAIGFDHLILFFDDPDDASIPVAAGRSNVTVTVNDAGLRRRWEQAGCNERTTALCTFANREVMAPSASQCRRGHRAGPRAPECASELPPAQSARRC